ncbi:hypothetical protein [Polyangium mundeleinium]|uniref:Secreted protein n=1 Tax=Polyangium mundeleinium TaxID=2995306 RepID=A0ABT5ETF7_9BACT|nr:hypothetical protein [Polyangium mundeleinium]MDC0744483.1 hypothetical protein [Polyangium mundeleinium]
MNVIKSLFFAVMSLGLVGTASVARAEQPVEEGIVAEAEGALMDEEATEERNITESDEALTSQDWTPFDYDDYFRRGGHHRCIDFCQDDYRDCLRYSFRWRRHGYPERMSFRRNRCEREFNFCLRGCLRRDRGPF